MEETVDLTKIAKEAQKEDDLEIVKKQKIDEKFGSDSEEEKPVNRINLPVKILIFLAGSHFCTRPLK